jgi:hypothetical protein
MAGTDMKNAILIALVVLILMFAIYQFDPTFFGIFGRREGFENVTNAGGASPSANAHGNAPPGNGVASPGSAQAKQNSNSPPVNPANKNGNPQNVNGGLKKQPTHEGFADLNGYEGPAEFGTAEAPAGCYPRDQLTPSELLPKDMNSIWAEQNPMGPGSLKGKNFLSAGALIGVNTIGQSLRNANLQVRSEPPCPQMPVSIFNQSTISPDISHRPLEIGS